MAYTLMVLLLVAGILGGYILINRSYILLFDQQGGQEAAWQNLQSGVHLFLSEGFQQGRNQAFQLFDDSTDSCFIQTENWGLFGLIHGQAQSGRHLHARSALVGAKVPNRLAYSLYIRDVGGPLVVSGNTMLKGKIFVPRAGIRAGYVGQKRFTQDQLFVGDRLTSGNNLPFTPQVSSVDVMRSFREILSRQRSQEEFLATDITIQQPWTDAAYQINAEGHLILHDVSLQGKCIITAEKITLTPQADLNGTLLFARNIVFQSGFKGDVQAFALDSLWVESDVHLDYPSVLLVSKYSSQAPSLLHIAAGAKIQGMVLYDNNLFGPIAPNRQDLCFVDRTSRLEGILYAAHQLDLRGEVIGSVTAGNIIHQSTARLYKNYLVDATIDFERLSSKYLAPHMFTNPHYRVLSWLNYPEIP
ncbi:MAG: hypothetical protein AAFW00_13500 [Bacteroidota bacterium]